VQPYTPQYLVEQARRTESTRRFLFDQVDWKVGPVALDLGCGPGTATEELCNTVPHTIALGLDMDKALLQAAIDSHPEQAHLHFLLADASMLPVRSSCVTFALSHFTLMWIHRRNEALSEVFRILRRHGVLAAIEPDYGGRIEASAAAEAPTERSSLPIVKWLLATGANPYMGSQLPAELQSIGLKSVRFGVLAWEHNLQMAEAESRGEAALLDAHGLRWSPPRFSFTPIFWVLAKKD
jgi:SAM-dependent methyltransferase